jgi:hypothetical protein
VKSEMDLTTIRLPYVKVYVDRSGKVRRYFRRPGSKTVPLPGAPGTVEFNGLRTDRMGTAMGQNLPPALQKRLRDRPDMKPGPR